MKRLSVEPWIENDLETGCLQPALKQNTNDHEDPCLKNDMYELVYHVNTKISSKNVKKMKKPNLRSVCSYSSNPKCF